MAAGLGERSTPTGRCDDGSKERRYALTMFPYPSGDLHMGHGEVFALHDVLARYWRLKGYDVLNPIGWDSFGLPAENAAIRRNEHPAEYTYANIETQAESLRRYAISFDWSRRLHTSDPDYYRWTQWLFLRFREHGLTDRRDSWVNWCPNDQTVLANEQVVGGVCDRCGAAVTKRQLTQWYFRITEYAQRLLDDMSLLEHWPDRILTMQRNWIGRSEGAFVDFAVDGLDEPLRVFTTRPDTLFGTTYMVVAPESPMAARLVSDDQREAFEAYLQEAQRSTDVERMSTERPKTGVFLGAYATNPATGRQIPIWTADYVLADYGTGAIMAVPGQDQRDWDFAVAHDLPIVRTVQPPDDFDGDAYVGEGAAINSANDEISLDGLAIEEAKAHITDWLEAKRAGGAHGQLPAARLAAEPAALLGLPDPDRALRRVWGGAGARRPAAGGAAPPDGHGSRPQGHVATGGRDRLGQHHLPVVRWSGQARHRHDGHLRRLVVVLPALRARRTTPSVRTTPRPPTGGCRRRTTSAAPSTRCCTCCTSGSSPRCCTTWACWTPSSRRSP